MVWTGILIATAAGGVFLFVWTALMWMAVGHHRKDYVPVPEVEEDLEAVIGKLPHRNAFYAIPHMANYDNNHSHPDLIERMKSGPNALVIRMPEGPPMDGGTFMKSFIVNLCEAFFVAVLIQALQGALPELWQVVVACGGIALAISIASYVSLAVWMALPKRLAMTSTIDKVTGYALMGIIFHFLL